MKIEYDFVHNYFTSEGCTLLETSYVNSKTKMQYVAKCGHNHEITWNKFYSRGSGRLCPKCSRRHKYTESEVSSILLDEGCNLIYYQGGINNSLVYFATCSHVKESTLARFMSGSCRLCTECSIKSRSGKNHPNYNPNKTYEEKYRHRNNSPDQKKWRRNVFDRDNYTCTICGATNTIIEAHHINGYNLFPEDRLVLSNGATLCKVCHDRFHKAYGNGDNTSEQFDQFKLIHV